jgi:hypothetical protein
MFVGSRQQADEFARRSCGTEVAAKTTAHHVLHPQGMWRDNDLEEHSALILRYNRLLRPSGSKK